MPFRVAFTVDDKNLARVLIALTGLVRDMEPPVPVLPRPANGASGDRGCDLFLAQLKQPRFHTAQLREFLPTIGHSPKSTNTQLAKLLLEKRVRRVRGVKATYEVVK